MSLKGLYVIGNENLIESLNQCGREVYHSQSKYDPSAVVGMEWNSNKNGNDYA